MSRPQEPDELSDDEEGDFRNVGRMRGRGDDEFSDEDEFSASTTNAGNPPGATSGGGGGAAPGAGLNDSQAVSNRPYDEAVELDDDEDSHPSPAIRPDAAGGPGSAGRPPQPAGAGARATGGEEAEGVVKNQPFDEAMELSSEESVDDLPEPQAQAQHKQPLQQLGQQRPQQQPAAEDDGGVYGDEEEPRFAGSRGPGAGGMQPVGRGNEGSDEGSEGSDDDDVGAHREVTAGEGGGGDDGGGGGGTAAFAGAYNPADYENLNVSAEIKELFGYIGRYKPHNIDLETKMKPFIPDYIPAVGEIDPFVKVPRPDGKADTLGLTVLDEPTSSQSDPVVLQLQLRAITKASSHQPVLVRSIEGGDKDPRAVQQWIDSIKELHRNKPQPSVTYTKPMPDVEELMQIWPAEFEEMLDEVKLPGADIDMQLRDYARLVCSVLDIPVYGSVMEPLHLLFTLFSDFKANVHFQHQFDDPNATVPGAGAERAGGVDAPIVEGQAESLSFD